MAEVPLQNSHTAPNLLRKLGFSVAPRVWLAIVTLKHGGPHATDSHVLRLPSKTVSIAGTRT
jgi:hypothetical protein